MSVQGIAYIDSSYGSDSNSGRTPFLPFQTLQKAYDSISPGGTIIMQDGSGSSYGDLDISKNVNIISSYGSYPKIGVLTITGANCQFKGLDFVDIHKGVIVNNIPFGSVSIKECRFDGQDTCVELNYVNYVSLHRNLFKNFKHGVQINEAIEVNINSNIFKAGGRPVDLSTVERLDLWRNTIYGATDVNPVVSPDENLRIIYRTLTPINISSKSISLPGVAASNDYGYDVAMNVVNGPSFGYGRDYIVVGGGTIVSWAGYQLESEYAVGDPIRIMYSEEGYAGGGDAIRAMNVIDPNSRVDSNNIGGITSDITYGVYFNSPLKIRYNNFYQTATWYQGSIPTDSSGNFSSDPKYTDPGNDDFSLQVISPDIDMGDPDRWDQIFNEMDIDHYGGTYTGGDGYSRYNVAPFNREIDFTGVHRYAVGISGDIGAQEYNPEALSLGNFIDEDGYDYAYPGTETGPYATLDRAYQRAQSDIQVNANTVMYGSETGLMGPTGGTDITQYGRYKSKRIILGDVGIDIGAMTDRAIAFVTPSYATFETDSVYVSPDGDDGYTGTIEAPYRTIDRALQSTANQVIVLPGFYPKFKGVSGKHLAGVQEIRYLSHDYRTIYYFEPASAYIKTGTVELFRHKLTLTDASRVILGNYTVIREYRVRVTVGADRLDIWFGDKGTYRATGIILDPVHKKIIIKSSWDAGDASTSDDDYVQDVSAYAVGDVFNDLRIQMFVVDIGSGVYQAHFRFRTSTVDISKVIPIDNTLWFFVDYEQHGMGSSVLDQLYIDAVTLSSTATGVPTGIVDSSSVTGIETSRKIYAIYGATGMQQ